MKTSTIIAAAAVALFAAAGAQAETYEGVQQINSTASRSEVRADAVQAAHAGNVYGDATYGEQQAFVSTASRSAVRAQAVAAAHNPLQNLDAKAFVNSQIPAQYKRAPEVRQQAAL